MVKSTMLKYNYHKAFLRSEKVRMSTKKIHIVTDVWTNYIYLYKDVELTSRQIKMPNYAGRRKVPCTYLE